MDCCAFMHMRHDEVWPLTLGANSIQYFITPPLNHVKAADCPARL
jgi:hypothetical protein